MVDIDCIMAEDDFIALNEYRLERDSDELVSHEYLKRFIKKKNSGVILSQQ